MSGSAPSASSVWAKERSPFFDRGVEGGVPGLVARDVATAECVDVEAGGDKQFYGVG
jgi:hypothetical protein